MIDWLKRYGVVVLILCAGVFLRLWHLGLASYQIDELATMQMWQQDHSVREIFSHALRDLHWNHRMVLLPLINMFLMEHGGYSSALPPEWMSRLPHAIMGIFALPVFWLFGRAYGGRKVAWWALLLSSFSIFAIYYAREAYDYSSLIFLSAGVCWCSLEVFNRRMAGDRVPWGYVIGYILFSSVLLMSHLAGLLFLACWLMALAGGMLAVRGLALFRQPREWGFWAVVLLPCFILFVPFLLKLMGGYTSADTSASTMRFSLSSISAVLGRLGWGESPVALVLFVGVILAGLVLYRRMTEQTSVSMIRPWLIVGAALAYFVAQSWALRVARMETRYYTPLFPLLILMASVGMASLETLLAGRRRWLTPVVARVMLCVPLLGWLAPSLVAVVQVHTRGYNYKGVAEWVMKNIQENGTYAFYNVYELRGTPHTYPTPGRNGTSVAAWSSKEDFERARPWERVKTLFVRFPQIVFLEIAPEDLFSANPHEPPVERDGLFMRHEWIEDPDADLLFRLKTHPMGETQWNTKNMHRILVSYNLPEDLPALALQQGKLFYYYFGPGWHYANDRAYNHWMGVWGEARFTVGNVAPQALRANLHFRLFAPRPGCQFHVFSSQGVQLATFDLNSQGLIDVYVKAQMLPPGESTYRVTVTAPATGETPSPALLYSLEIEQDTET